MIPGGPRYTSEQEQVIELPADSRAIVDAAAGTGKTHVLAGRLTRLVERDELIAGDELLVLSFSRAAVSELRARVGRLGGDARFVGAATFDSFASQLLGIEEPDGAWRTGGYEQRILAAVELLQRSTKPQLLSMVRHVLVDEMQDLVGTRASLVSALLDRVDAGFTLFGDPAQAIYGHQLAAGSDGVTNVQLYEWLIHRFDGELSRFSLTHDFRGATEQAAAIARVGQGLREAKPEHAEIASELRTIVLRLPAVTLGTARRLLLRSEKATSAVLSRTNGEALRMSSEMFGRDIPHRYQRRGEDKAAAGWLGKVVLDVDGTTTTRSALMSRIEPIADGREETADEMFALIRRLDPARGEGVDLRRVASRVREASFPEELNEVVPGPVVVSTIHRAKGLEFDRVLLCEPGDGDDSDAGEENRVLYVALSRARREIFHLPRPDTKGLGVDRASRRWVRRGFGANRWRIFELEVFGSDVDAVRPAGTRLFEDDAPALQRYLLDEVMPGDPVELVLAERTADEDVTRFVIRHRDRPIGVTSDAFGSVLSRVLGSKSRPPRTISALRVEMVDTVAGDAAVAHRVGLASHGIWSRVRIFGLGCLTFDRTREGVE